MFSQYSTFSLCSLLAYFTFSVLTISKPCPSTSTLKCLFPHSISDCRAFSSLTLPFPRTHHRTHMKYSYFSWFVWSVLREERQRSCGDRDGWVILEDCAEGCGPSHFPLIGTKPQESNREATTRLMQFA